VLGILVERAFTERFLPTITLQDLNAEAAEFDASNRLVLVIAPEKQGLATPDEAALAAVVARVEAAQIAPYEEQLAGGGSLLPNPPEPAPIASRRELAEIGATELVLANGARVLYKPTRLREEEVLFAASSPGGASLVSDEDYPEARLAGEVVAESGVGEFSRTDLAKVLAGADVGVVPSIDAYFEGMEGEARSADLTALFQLIHLYFTAPRQDRTVATRIPLELVSRLENMAFVPEAVLQQAVAEAIYGKSVRAGRLPVEELKRIDAERMFQIYRERFGNAGDFTFSFVGSFDPQELEGLVQRYLGTLPAAPARDAYRAVLPPPPPSVVTRTLAQGREERSMVRMVFEGALGEPVTPRLQLRAELLEQSLAERLQGELRETRGATYGVGVSVAVAEVPEPTYRATIDFTTDPRRVDELVGVVLQEIEELRMRAPSPVSLAVSKEAERREREEALGNNGFWLGVLDRWAKFPDSDPREVLDFESELDAVSAEEVRALGEQILQRDRYVQVVLQPEEAGSSPAK
jgi:zinc protease